MLAIGIPLLVKARVPMKKFVPSFPGSSEDLLNRDMLSQEGDSSWYL